MKNLRALALSGMIGVFLLGSLIMPVATPDLLSTANAQEKGIVECGRTGDAQTQALDCDFYDLIRLIQKGINFLIVIATLLAAIAFMYAGWLYLSAGGDTGQVTKANGIFKDVAFGFIIILSAWLFFDLIGRSLLNTKGGFNTYLQQK